MDFPTWVSSFSNNFPETFVPRCDLCWFYFLRNVVSVLRKQYNFKHNVCEMSNEPAHDKTDKIALRPAKTKISLDTRPVWSVFAVIMKKAWVLSYPLIAHRRLWSDWADAQADLRLRRAHMLFCRMCHALAQILLCFFYVSICFWS